MKIILKLLAATLVTLPIYTVAFSQTSDVGSSSTSVEDALKKIDELTIALKVLDPAAFRKANGAGAKVEALVNQLYVLSSGLDQNWDKSKAAAIAAAARALSTAITSAAAPSKVLLQQDDNSNQTLNDLLIAIQNLGLRDPGRVIRVNEAKFGDTYTGNVNVKRWCDATSFMRANCDRHGTCSLPQNYQDLVCGFNPAPSADLRDRGLYVDYQCVPNIEVSFTGTYDPTRARSSSPVLKKSRSEYVVLRGGGALLCGGAK